VIRRLICAAWLVLWAVLLPGPFPSARPACAASPNHAAERIRFSLTDERTFCVDFSEQEISGIKALRLTGLPIVTKVDPQFGEFVCKIGEVGTDVNDCPARDGSYWSYFVLDANGTWRPSSVGASGSKVRCGGGEGWSWFARGAGAPPSAPTTFASMCPGRSCQAQTSPSPSAGAIPSQPGGNEPRPSPRSTPKTGTVPAPTASPSIGHSTPTEAETSSATGGPTPPPSASSNNSGGRGRAPYVLLAGTLLILTSSALYFRYLTKGH
jgi:hypothetical protein